MRRLFGFFIFVAAGFLTTGCSPVGTIGGSAEYDSMWTVPYRIVYDINDLFLRYQDLSVFASCRGAIQPIPVDQVTISVIEDPDWSGEETPVPHDSGYPLLETGRKIIVVKYGKLAARYSIDVRDPFGLEGNNNNGSGSGIIIEWEEP